MAEYTSEIKIIPYQNKDVFAVLSDLNNLELAKDKIPQDKIKGFSFDKDSCTVTVDPIGQVRFLVVEREPDKTIKFQAEQLPFDVKMWIQLLPDSEGNSRMKLTIQADLNPFLKPMVSKPLQTGIDKVVEVLAALPYREILNNRTEE
ncbi:SRPBCC family protein [Dysgonomonas sp. 511]|uniref:SRPBCC family protein n=1 Tax=Dysgonomonas sp. 511 TaxID=2302930 RepID=UPI0013D7AEA8|nr:SRPBCC family protein [Dysgonomonas sp. 511]NDV77372.1 SRPBCC family protein [Dysgonomonas sp. 511]